MFTFSLTSGPKPKTTVGLDIEAGSVAATELLGLNVGSAAELADSVTGKTYRVEVARIKQRTSSTPPG